MHRSAAMSAIAPPALGAEAKEDSTFKLENDRAIATLSTRQEGTAIRSATRHSRTTWLGSLAGLAALGVASAAVAIAGGRLASKKRNKAWYRTLRKASFTPPDRALRLVWPALYTLGAVSAWRVARAPESKERSAALGLWATQLAFNGAWTPLFFGAHRPELAMATLAGNHASLGAYALAARKIDKTAAWLVVPYLGWVTFAGVLNASVVAKNRGALARALARI
jgi:tryptophan-rich sensory protein